MTGNRPGGGEGFFEPGKARVAVNQHAIKVNVHEPHDLRRARSFPALLEDVANRRYDTRLRSHGRGRFEQRNELEAHLPPPERERLEHQNVGTPIACERQQAITPGIEVLLLNRIAAIVDERSEIDPARAQSRQGGRLYVRAGEACNRHPAPHHHNIEPVADESVGDPARPHQMPDTEQMLDVEQHAGTRVASHPGAAAPEANDIPESAKSPTRM